MVKKTEIIEAKAKEVPEVTQNSFELQENSAERLMAQAISAGQAVSVDTMERLMAMRRELKKEWAEEQYNSAMAKFQDECPTIEKKKEAKEGQKVLYKYAPLDSIIDQVQDLISKNGFSYNWDTEETEKTITVFCIITHKYGHVKKSRFTIPSTGGTSIMSGPQRMAAALTFGKRYAFCNAFGIMTGDEDVDAAKNIVEPPQPAPQPPQPPKAPVSQIPVFITSQQAEEIKYLLKELRIKDAMHEIQNVIERDLAAFKDLKYKEADAVLADFRARLERVKSAPDVNMVDPSINAPKREEKHDVSFATRATNCKTQEEATNIIGEATLTKDISDIQMQALKNILIAKKFNV